MSIVVVSDLAKSYGAELIFSGASFRVEQTDRVSLVGPNGSGKSTLLRLIAGMLIPDSGSARLEDGTRVGYLAQDADLVPERTLYDELLATFAEVHAWEAELGELAERLGDPHLLGQPDAYATVMARYAELQARFEHAGGYTTEQRVRQVLDGLGFSREQQSAPAAQLSGGQRTRAALGKLLLQEPDLLLLDEPTNHLDMAALEWLEEYLVTWRGAVMVVSHDRYFLDRVTTRTIEVADQRVTSYPGNYSRYLGLRAEHMERWAREYEAQQEYIARTEEFIRRYRAGQRSKEARGRQTLLDRMERIERPPGAEALHFTLSPAFHSGEVVLRTEGLVAGFAAESAQASDGVPGGGLRVRLGDVEVRRGERIGLIGPNGAGKTTLLRTIVRQLEPVEGRAILGHNVHVGYFAQTHDGLNGRLAVLDQIRQVSHLSDEGARSLLGRFLFSGDDVFKPISALSGGERSRVALATLALQGANFLVLDEPTNHLDLPARQVLEQLVSEYDGTLLFVSHDRYFLDALAERIWSLADGTVTDYAGNYSAYRAQQARAEAARMRAREVGRASARSGPNAGTQTAAAGVTRVVQRSVDEVEAEIGAVERHLTDLEAQLNEASAAADVVRITALGEEYAAEQARLEGLYLEWEERAG